ncbi:MAG: amidohydrolase family protein [Microcoleaceae cyanobacterium]
MDVRRLLRIENIAQNIIPQVNSFEDFWEKFRGKINPPPPEVVGFKSIAAYRTGLDIQPVIMELAKSQFNALKKTTGEKPPRLSDKSLIDFLVIQTLEVAAKYKMPIQFHTGFGDPDLDLRLSNPLHLRCLLENNRFRNAPIVLLHSSYPYTREAGYLASVYPNIYIGFGLAIPSLSVAGMRCVVRQLMELAPISKLMYSSDAHLIPDLYYLGAKWGRKVLEKVLDESVRDGDLTVKETEETAMDILRGNASRIYQLNI